MCNLCEDKTYCNDCRAEEKALIEEIAFPVQNSKSDKSNRVQITGDYLYHKGRAYHISEVFQDKRMKQKSIIGTKEGLLFHIRELENKEIVLTKIVRIKARKEGRPDYQECQKIFIGRIPSRLLADPNW
jgi:hypothetical protein